MGWWHWRDHALPAAGILGGAGGPGTGPAATTEGGELCPGSYVTNETLASGPESMSRASSGGKGVG